MAKKPKTAAIQYSADKLAARDQAIAILEKEHGTGIISLGQQIVDIDVIPTGALGLDIALGVGGIPRGRITEIFGPESSGKTTLALTIAYNAQKEGGIVAFIDAEHALDPTYARKIGVDLDKLMITQPDNGEQALNITETLCESGAVDLIVIDSVAALVPKAELDGEVGDSHIGAQSRMMSQCLRKLAGKAKRSNTAVVFINQLREKIGVMFGCLHGSTTINLVDGRALTIKEIVDDQIEGEVWSFDELTQSFVPKRIIDWHYNGDVESPKDYLTIMAKGPGNRNGQMAITVTPDHQVMTNTGWVEAGKLQIGSPIVTKYDNIMAGPFGQFLSGVLSGDSHINRASNRFNGSLMIQDNNDLEYAKWKVAKLADLNFDKYEYGNKVQFRSSSYTFLGLHQKTYPQRDPMVLLDNFSWLGMSVWIMDDAMYVRDRYHLSIKRFRGNFAKIEQISMALDKLGLYYYASEGGNITFDKASSDLIANQISMFVPPCMSRKLPPCLRGLYVDYSIAMDTKPHQTFATVVSIKNASPRQMKFKGKYDISVQDNHCYLAGGSHNGLLVHNSPETTPGGRALKFYASVRLDIRKIGQNKVNDVASGNKTRVKVVKNKVAPPFKEAEFEIVYGKGIDNNSCLLTLGVEYGLLDKKGSHYSMGEIKLGNGDAAASAFLANNEPMACELEVEILQRSKKELIVKPQNGATTALAKGTILEDDDDGFDETIE